VIVEIRKAGFINKGAELMLHAILQKMKEVYPAARFVMAPSADNGYAPYARRAELGLLQKAWLWKYGLQLGDLAGLVPKKIREMYGVLLDREVDVVLDAAGFSYSDQFGAHNSIELARACKRWKKNKTRVVLLPQAMGPFTSKKINDAIKTVADNADLIFARERISYDHLVSVAGERPSIRIAPDFTNLIEGKLPKNFDVTNNRFCLVPNYRMIDMTPKEQSRAYLPFMVKCANYLLEKELKPFILVHEGAKDLMMAEKISGAVGGCIPIVKESHPLKIKGILGACDGTIGSRFHGLVSALCQGVPSLGTGWSHKYRMLFEDYGFADGLIDVTISEEEIRQKIDLIAFSPKRPAITNSILTKSNDQKKLSSEMWDDILKVFKGF
jgi:colanic acid/amylovoran biosynthesis protein